MTRLLIASALLLGLAAPIALAADAPADAPADASCDAKALDKNGKPLAGAAKSSFMKKCQNDAKTKACEGKAQDKNGKALAGAAKASFMKKCQAGG